RLMDGNIEFVGRGDSQVKIRGYRIEPGEIENVLLKEESVKEAIVIVKEDIKGDKMLCAYVVSDAQLEFTEIRRVLQKELPDYMIPAFIMHVDSIPLTHSGKVDRKALPELIESLSRETEYEGPTNEIEQELMEIWTEVLGIKRMGINDNFFMMGGHSLKLMSLVSNIHKRMNIDVPLKELFIRPTIRGLAEYLEKADVSIYKTIEPVEEKEYYPVSSAQKRMYILSEFENVWTSYNTQLSVVVKGKLDVVRFEKAIKALVRRHESFRTSFGVVGDEIVQKVNQDVDFQIEYMEASEEEAGNIVEAFVRPFDLGSAPLLRVGLIKIKESEYILICDMHHIITDGVSHGILLNEFSALYEGRTLPELRLQYKDFAHWQNTFFKSGAIDKQREYWKEQFKDEIPVLNMPTDYLRPKIQSFEGSFISFALDSNLTSKLKELTVETGTTMHMVLLTVLNVLLYKYTGQEDVVIGTGIVGRPHADLENIVGMFVNMLAMRNHPQGSKTFKEFLKEVRESSLKAYENQDYQFEMLVDTVNTRRDPERNPIYDVMFTAQNIDVPEIALEDVEFRPYHFGQSKTHADLNILAYIREDVIRFSLEYCTKLFRKETVERLARHFTNAAEEVVKNPDALLCEIKVMDKDEEKDTLYSFNDTATQYPVGKTVCRLFEEQMERTPDNIAIEAGGRCLTYRELNEKANRLARVLREKGVKQDSIVAIMADQSVEFVVAVLGVLKAGGAYLPID
ncbi:condensation domain-containing protein, partial [Ruminiclostridium cellobioparum]|uniref:condensation domain-containing protein n=1 Tax=Ruminiclostridium cellobioparum TaxID=29355 RepID=UPI000557DCC7